MTALRLFLDGRSALLGATPALASPRLQPGRTGLAPTTAVSVGTGVTLDAVNQRFRAAADALSAAFRSLGSEAKPVYAVSVASQPSVLASVAGRSARLDPVAATASVLRTTVGINTQTSTVQSSASPLGLDLSPGVASRLASATALGLDVTSPEAPALLRSSAALGVDSTSTALADVAAFQSVTSGSFTVDGHTIAVEPTTDSVQSVLDRINASGARVVASYDAQRDAISLETTVASEDRLSIAGDTSGFLAAALLDPANTVAGNVRDDRQALAKTSQFAGVTSGTFEIGGQTIAVDAATDSLSSIIDRINAAGAGVTASYDAGADVVRLVGTSASEDAIAIGNDGTGLLAAARLDAANTVRGNVPDDEQALSKTTQLASVAAGSFDVNGVAIAVDPTQDALRTVIDRVNAAGAGVTASYDSTSDTLVLTPDAAGGPVVLAGDTSGFLAAVKLSAGAFGTHVNAGAAFDGGGLDAPFLDPGLSVHAGSFTVNGVAIAVGAGDSIDGVLARITASAAGVTASYDDTTQTVALVRADGGSITLGADTSGFLAAVKLDATAAGTPGTPAASAFDAVLGRQAEYASVHAGTLTVNGHDVAVDPASTTVRGLVSSLDALDGIAARLDDSTGGIRIASTNAGATVTLADTSGVLDALGIRSGTYRGTVASSTVVQTQTGTVTVSNSGKVAAAVSAAVQTLNDALSLLGSARDASSQQQGDVRSALQSTVEALARAGVAGVRWSGDAVSVDAGALASALDGVLGGRASPADDEASALDALTAQIAALGAPPAAAKETRDELRANVVTSLEPVTGAGAAPASALLVKSLLPGQSAAAFAAGGYGTGTGSDGETQNSWRA